MTMMANGPLQPALPLGEAAETSFTLPSSWYTDPAVFEEEISSIFHRTWQYVAHRSAFVKEGDYVTLSICGQNIFVMLGGDGELRAFYNVCRHRAHELLSEPSGNVRSVIVCPYHAWTFEREGGLRGAPMANQRPGFDKADFGLRQVRLEIFLGCVFVNLDETAAPLHEIAGDLEEDIRGELAYVDRLRSPSLSVEVLGETVQKAGWKVVVDNYVECYHCRHAHPDFSSLICMDEYEIATGRYWSRQIGREVRSDNTAYALADDAKMRSSAFWYLWPNTTFNVLPGSEELAVYAIRPIDHETSSFEGHVLSAGGEVNEVRTRYTAEVLAPEDIALCESVQRGLRSKGYDQGSFVAGPGLGGESEASLHHFHRLVMEALTGADDVASQGDAGGA
ncbi:MAG: SRPBCC family protein [Pseudomonadota bacterium]